MSNLEQRLQHVKKITVTEADVNRATIEIRQKTKANRLQIVPAIVTVCLFALMCFLIFMPPMNQTKQSTALFENNITKMEFVYNYEPNRVFQIASANYVLSKQVMKDPSYLRMFEEMLQAAQNSGKKWTENLQVDFTYDLAVYLANGEIANLKLYDDYEKNIVTIIDTNEKIAYSLPLTDEELARTSSGFYESERVMDFSSKGILIVGLLIVAGLLLDIFYLKKYAYLDERGKRKRLHGAVSGTLYVVLIIPLIMMNSLLGIFHLGLALVLLFVYMFLISYLQIRLKVMRPNSFYYKVLLPLYSLGVIASFLLILVV